MELDRSVPVIFLGNHTESKAGKERKNSVVTEINDGGQIEAEKPVP